MGVLTKDLDLESVEADFGEGPVEVFYRRMNMMEIDTIEKARASGAVEVAFVTLTTRARTHDGLKLFDAKKDRSKIMRQFDPSEIARVLQVIKEFDAAEVEAAGNC